MSAETVFVPPSTLLMLDAAPLDRPVVVLLRHSARPPLPPGDEGFDIPITDDGVRIARELGAQLGPRLRSLHSSPLLRCVQTAQCIAEGARASLAVRTDTLLGHPGVFVVHGGAGRVWRQLGHDEVMAHLVGARDAELDGVADADAAARFLVQRMLSETTPGIHVFVTHDSLVTATAARLLGIAFDRSAWPLYLDGAWFWRDGPRTFISYRDWSGWRDEALCTITERDVLALARREINAVIDEKIDARFFLAGGAFKSLLTGRRARDLDLWAPSEDDRARLIVGLRERGASLVETRPYSEVFGLGDRVIDVPTNCSAESLESRLARFDIGLSAIGVEHAPGGALRASVSPIARESVARREVLFCKPLVNQRHALTSLVRLRRYGHELGFAVPASEENVVWDVFDAQDDDEKRTMIDRLRRSEGEHALADELAARGWSSARDGAR